MLKKILSIITLSVSLSSLLASMLYFKLTKINNELSYPLKIEINKGESFWSVAQRLDQLGLISDKTLFYIIGRVQNLNRTDHGVFTIREPLSILQLLKVLQKADPIQVPFTIRDGTTFNQLLEQMSAFSFLKDDISGMTQKEIASKLGLDHESLEGLIFPDTYFIDQNSTRLSLIRRGIAEMEKHLTEVWEKRKPKLAIKSKYELLIMASIIEKESGHHEDIFEVSAVFNNRLMRNMRLQSDPTVIYGLQLKGKYMGTLSKSNLREDGPFNTYTRLGLPPTPISFPSRASLNAAANPSNSKYLYFVARGDGSGKSHFSMSLEEHNSAVRRYRKLKKQNENML